MRCAAAVIAGMFVVSTAAAAESMTAEEEVRAMIGRQHAGAAGVPLFADLSCVTEYGGVLWVRGKRADGWWQDLVRCKRRMVLVLHRNVRGDPEVAPRWQVVDALVLPHELLDFDPEHPKDVDLYQPGSGQCAFDGHRDDIYALVREVDNRPITWRRGLLGAWSFDPKGGRILPLPLKRVVCDLPDRALH